MLLLDGAKTCQHNPMELACLLAPHAECLSVNLYLLIVNIYYNYVLKQAAVKEHDFIIYAVLVSSSWVSYRKFFEGKVIKFF